MLEYQYISLVVENGSCIECELFAITLFMKRLSTMITTCVEPVMNSIAADFGPAATLDQVSIGDLFSVRRVQAPHAAPEWARWLEEIGFIDGEKVSLMARALPGGDPLVVRVGQSTFALRRAEAACVHVSLPKRLDAQGKKQ